MSLLGSSHARLTHLVGQIACCLAGWVAGFATSFAATNDAVSSSSPPNIVVILADDLGYGDLSSFGATTISTPNIDALGANGLRFTHFYAAASVCTPSRAGLLTGRQASRMGMRHVFMHDSPDGMPQSEVTIAEQLQQAGYRSGMVGKWHLGHLDRFMPWNQGFDEFYGVPFSNDMPNLFFYDNQAIDYTAIDQRYLTKRYTDKALDFIERHTQDNAEQPFFLYVAHSMPHVPVYASPDFEGSSQAGVYGDAVQEIDWSTGQIIGKLRALGIEQNTLVMFTSDNGPWLTMGANAGSAGALRDGKGSAFEGGQRVPTLMQWPAGIPRGVVIDAVVSFLDLMPTFSRLAGVALPTDRLLDGRDVSELLRSGTPANAAVNHEFYYQGMLRDELVAVRQGNWKLKLPRSGYPAFIEPLLKLEFYAHGTLLFDLADDPGEQRNRAADFPERVDALKALLAAKQGEMEADRDRRLVLSATPADRKGFGLLIARVLGVGLGALLLLGAMGYWLYRGVRRLRRRAKDAPQANSDE